MPFLAVKELAIRFENPDSLFPLLVKPLLYKEAGSSLTWTEYPSIAGQLTPSTDGHCSLAVTIKRTQMNDLKSEPSNKYGS